MSVRRPLRARLQLATVLAVLLFGTLNLLLVGRITYVALRTEQERRLTFVTRLLAQRAVSPILFDDRLAMAKLLDESRRIDPDLASIVVLDPRGQVLASSQSEGARDWLTAYAAGEIPRWGIEGRFREAREPILDGRLGEVRVGVSAMALRTALARVVTIIAGMVVTFLAAAMIVAAFLARSVTRPIEKLVSSASRVTLDGPLPEFEVGSDDEIAVLAQRLGSAARRLRELHARIRVQEREMARVERLAAIGALAAGVAHEINNPLAGIRAALERLLRQSRDPAQAEKYGVVLRDAISRIERAVQGTLSLARASDVVLERVVPAAVVERALALAAPGLEQARISVVQDVPLSLPEVTADGAKLTQVVLNLLLNALDAMPQGSSLSISGARTERAVVLEVADTGPGVPASQRELIFTPFFTTKPVGAGTGLGLAVSRTAVREMGGELSLVSDVVAGARFRIELPIAIGGHGGTDSIG